MEDLRLSLTVTNMAIPEDITSDGAYQRMSEVAREFVDELATGKIDDGKFSAAELIHQGKLSEQDIECLQAYYQESKPDLAAYFYDRSDAEWTHL